jgi:hypothetical protein
MEPAQSARQEETKKPLSLEGMQRQTGQVAFTKDHFEGWFERMQNRYEQLEEQHGDLAKIRKKMPRENYNVGNLPPHVQKALATNAGSLFFSADSLAKQLNHHPEVTAAEHFSVLSKIKNCTEVYESGNYHVVLVVKDGIWYKLALKTSRDYTTAHLLSLHRLNEKTLSDCRKLKRIY